jgi:hypothetical protein
MIELCDEKLGIGPCYICERDRRMSGKSKCICVAGYKMSCPIHGLKPMERKTDISLKEGIDFLRQAGMRVIVIGEDAVDTGDNPDNRTVGALALTYISYVKERFPQVHYEADGSPSIEEMIRKIMNEEKTST